MDTLDPTFTVPSDTTLYRDASCAIDTTTGDIGDVTDEADNCSSGLDATYVDDVSGLSGCNSTGTFTRTWTLEDDCGNTAVEVQTITVLDTLDPTFTVPADVTIYRDATCNIDTTTTDIGDVTDEADNCSTGLEATYVDDVSGLSGCNSTGTFTRTWTLEDDCGNTTVQVQTITVLDTLDPDFSLPANLTVYRDASCALDTTVAATGDVTDEEDNCSTGLEATYVDDVTGLTGCSNSGTFTRTWTLLDDCGNSIVKVQTITVQDTTKPFLTCPADTVLDCQNADTTAANLGYATATDNCSLVKITYSDQVTPSSCAGFYSFVRTWVAEDSCGNTTSCQQQVTLQDINKPDFTFVPADTTIDCDADTSAAQFGFATATDNCAAVVTITREDDIIIQPGGCLLPSGIRRTWTATDDCGNFRQAFQIITFQDTTAPVITFCPPDTVVNCGVDTSDANLGSALVTDNCTSPIDIAHSDVVTPGVCSGTYSFIRTWTITDYCGNSVSCVQMVSVQDTIDPVFLSCPQDTIVNCINADTTTASLGFPSASDNCGGNVSITYADQVTSSNCAGDFTFVRTFTATDVCGHTSTCAQTVTVVDNILMSCPQDTAVCAYDQPFALGGATPAGGTFSGPGVTANVFDPSAAGPGDHVIIYTYTVNYCCVHSCTLNIHVDSAIAVICPANMQVCASDEAFALSGALPLGGTYSGTGVSGGMFSPQQAGTGTWNITYTVSSPNGCISTCSFSITVVPEPVASCPADLEACITRPAFNLTGASPAGGTFSGPGVSGTQFTPSVAGLGTHQIMYVVANLGLCYDTCTFDITVYDQPAVSCPPNDTVCIDAPAFALSGASPAGGTYSGPSVSAGQFRPAIAGIGTHTITYTYNDGNNCSNTCTFTIRVAPKPVVVCPTSFAVCFDDQPFALSGATPAGGVYAGPGVSGGIFNPALAGGGVHTITYTYFDNNQCENSCSFTIGVGPVLNAGPDTFIYIGDQYTFHPSVAGPGPMQATWSPALTLLNPHVLNATAWPIAPETFTVVVTDNSGCSATDQVFLNVLPRGNSFSGQVYYDNQYQTPLPGFGVIFSPMNSKVADTIFTRFNGLFDIDSLADGTYTVGGFSNQPWAWGGVNATDALLVTRHFIYLDTLDPFRALVGDVNGSKSINSTDAMLIAQRFAGIIHQFPVPDWFLEPDTITYPGITPLLYTKRYRALSAGDVNGSHVPNLKVAPKGSLGIEGLMVIGHETAVTLPLTLSTPAAVGAVSLQLIIPQGVVVTGVSVDEAIGGDLIFKVEGNLLNIAWVGLDAPLAGAGQPFFHIGLLHPQRMASGFVLGDVLEVADPQGNVIPNARFTLPEVVGHSFSELTVRNYPNPFSEQSVIEYYLPEEGRVSLEVFNVLGERVSVLVNTSQSAGQHRAVFSAEDLVTGTYYFRLSHDDGGQ
ncbi:MAG TPA: T9SS type A sorting domain-containing protein, partial [Bacteroidales bacterium]|nr:T9SS type A sorting domain-containing protein [Bacteroidales bacterium]